MMASDHSSSSCPLLSCVRLSAVAVVLEVLLTLSIATTVEAQARRLPDRTTYPRSDAATKRLRDTQSVVNEDELGGEAADAGKSASLHKDLSYDEIYSEWSAWSRCSKRCRQARTRLCKSHAHCGANLLKEERSCRGQRCQQTQIVVPHGDDEEPQSAAVSEKDRGKPSQFRVLYHLQGFVYSTWSEWSPCTKACRTRRYRACKMTLICGKNVIQEDALCYVEGTVCEKLYRRKIDVDDDYDRDAEEGSGVSTTAGKPNPLDTQACGVPKIKTPELRIIGGREAARGSWPWQVAVLNKFHEPFCGGTMIAAQWVLTAAHCARRRLYVRAGEHDLQSGEGTEQEIRVLEAFLHPDYDAETVDNDIALLRLKSPLIVNDYILPVCLPQVFDELQVDTKGTILGWGKRKNSAFYGTDVLHQAEVPIVDTEDCRLVYDEYYISDNMVCAGYKRGRVDSCAGDSGGPLLYERDEKWYIYGITSFGEGCGRKGKYGIYAKVPNYVGWIRKTVASNS